MTDKPFSRASRSNGDPGSVTTTICSLRASPAATKAAAKTALADAVSIVDPDFEETTTRVVARSPLMTCAK